MGKDSVGTGNVVPAGGVGFSGDAGSGVNVQDGGALEGGEGH